MLEQNMKFNKEIVSMKKNQTEMSELKNPTKSFNNRGLEKTFHQ